MEQYLKTLPRLPEETGKEILADLYAARESASWAEDAAGISGDSAEKAILDRALNDWLALPKA